MAVARLMGIVNVTPDSFSDGGLFLDAEAAIAHGRKLAEEGAEILDVGGESTRPGAAAVSAEEELARVAPVVAALAGDGGPGATVSIDTSKARVAAAALDAGAGSSTTSPRFGATPTSPVCARNGGARWSSCTCSATPRTMQEDPRYDDVVDDVMAFLGDRIEAAIASGIDEERIWIDPGIGFGKTVEHNLELLRRLGELRELGRPIVVGASRKSFIGKLTGREVDERLGGSVAAACSRFARAPTCSASTMWPRPARRCSPPRRSWAAGAWAA